jgi:hypothetical protein
MSKTARTDEIDELVSSVRDFVSHKEPPKQSTAQVVDLLVLTPEQRVKADGVAQTPLNAEKDAHSGEDNVLALDGASPSDRAGLEATIAELEAAVTAQSDDWEPDEGESFETSAWAASAFQTPSSDSEQTATPASSTAPSGLDKRAVRVVTLDDAQTIAEPPTPAMPEGELAAAVSLGISEKDLRALVVEIIHDELGGDLGERITRNVRKLVRSEINRVLTSREMGQG